MPRVTYVKKAMKDNPVAKKGEPYYWWAFMVGGRGGPKHYSKTPPKQSQLTQSDYLSQFYSLTEQIDDFPADDSLESNVADVANSFRELGEEQQSKFDNMPDGLQQGDTGQMIEQRANRCSEIADELENIDFSDAPTAGDEKPAEKPEDDAEDAVQAFWNEKLDEVQGVDFSSE